MVEQIFFHIGAPKTGTTFIQQVLLANRQQLASNGMLYVGERWTDHSHSAAIVRESPRLESFSEEALGAWDRLRSEARDYDGKSAIISHEYFSAASKDQAGRAIADLAPAEVHLVLTVRDLPSVLAAAWQQQVKYRQVKPLTQWWPKEDDTPRGELNWRTLDFVGVLERWTPHVPVERVHIVTVPPPGSPRTTLLQRFADACCIDMTGCDLEVPRANESLGVVEVELMRRINRHIKPPIRGFREVVPWLRNYLAQSILVQFGKEPFRLTEEQEKSLTGRTEETISYIAEKGFSVHGDLRDLTIRNDKAGQRTPDEVSEAELNAVAVQVIAQLVQDVRSRTRKNAELRRANRRLRHQLKRLRGSDEPNPATSSNEEGP